MEVQSQDKISIIVPFHSLENYLDTCLSSIQNQTYTNFEVIMLANNIHDSSRDIAKKYADADSRFLLYDFPLESTNISTIRNYALMLATGKYMIWVDGDDYISPNLVEIQYKSIKQTNADMAVCRVFLTHSRQHKFKNTEKYEIETLSAKQTQVGILTEAFVNGGLTNKMFRTDLAQQIRFDEYCSMFEDLEYVFRYLNICDSGYVAFNKKYIYAYYMRPGSLSNERKLLPILHRITTTNKIIRLESIQYYDVFARGLHVAIATPLIKKCKKTKYDTKIRIIFANYLREAIKTFKNIKMPFYKKLFVWLYYKKYKKYLKKPFWEQNKATI